MAIDPESYEYRMQSTSAQSARIEDIELELGETGLTRKILRAEIVRNARAKENPVKVAIVHQRRANGDAPWEDLGGSLSSLKAGEAAKISLDTDQTRALLTHLGNLYGIGEEGIRPGRTVLALAGEEEVIRTDASRARIIRKLLEADHGTEVWDALVEGDPDLATKMALARVYEERKKAVEEFEENLPRSLGEEYWQKLMERNRWIFGSAYVGRIGERRIGIGSTVDHPLISDDSCLDIVEIKKPEVDFWKTTRFGELFLYRGKYPLPNSELEGAIAQSANYILELEREMDSRSWAESHDGISPLKPRCLVVHGRSQGWGEAELKAFRLLNDRLHGIYVITFDHLLVRAKEALEIFRPDPEGGSKF